MLICCHDCHCCYCSQSSKANQKAVKDFKSISGASDKIATEILSAHSWQLETALDYFFTYRQQNAAATSASAATSQQKISENINAIFNKHSEADVMSDDMLAEYLVDIGLDPSE